MAMAHSGEMLDLSSIHGRKVDKHSTGGVGDKTSLALTPMVAACGIPVAKMSGRGLGHTGGTIDKLESFPGFSTSLTTEQFIENVNKIGIAIMGQTADLAPADKKLYALRDVTATVDNMSLIASSIMSKKLAAGADAIVLDVKTGSGAFMKSREDAFALAEEMVKIGKNAGRKTIAVISDMDQPLGRAVGNALEVKEAIATLRGEGPEDFKELCMVLGSRMLLAGSKAESVEEARNMLTNVIRDGSALRKLEQFVEAQGGDPAAVTDPELLPKASMVVPVCADRDGFVEKIACEDIGICSLLLGGGREDELRKLRQISGQRIAVDPQQIRGICRYCPELRNLFSDKIFCKLTVLPQIFTQLLQPLSAPVKCRNGSNGCEHIGLCHFIRVQPPVHPVPQRRIRNDHCCRLEPRQVKGLRGCHTGDAVIFTMLRYRRKWDILHPGSRNIAMDLIRQHQHMMFEAQFSNAL
jgi:pyrimidine-nucleoside phosphorylase